MTFDEYWQNLKERNVGLRSGDDVTMKISVATFQDSLRQAFGMGELFGHIFGEK